MSEQQTPTILGTDPTKAKPCGCGPDCSCGPDYACGPNGSCEPACTCGQ